MDLAHLDLDVEQGLQDQLRGLGIVHCSMVPPAFSLRKSAYSASSTNRQSAFASRICSIVRQLTSSRRGEQTRYARLAGRLRPACNRFQCLTADAAGSSHSGREPTRLSVYDAAAQYVRPTSVAG